MKTLGAIKELWRFPVKSMQGASVAECRVTSQGIVGDRCWAMRDEGRQEIQWGKMWKLAKIAIKSYWDEFVAKASGVTG